MLKRNLNEELIVYKINKNNADMKANMRKSVLNAISYAVLAVAGCMVLNPVVAGIFFAGAGYSAIKAVINTVKYSTALDTNKELKEVTNLTDKEIENKKDEKASKKLTVYKINKEKISKRNSFSNFGLTLAAAALSGIGLVMGPIPIVSGVILATGIVSLKESISSFIQGFIHKKNIENMNEDLNNRGETQKVYSRRIRKPHVTTIRNLEQLKHN